MVPSSGNLIQWRKSLFDTVLVYNNKNKPMLHYNFGSVYIVLLFSLLVFCLKFKQFSCTYCWCEVEGGGRVQWPGCREQGSGVRHPSWSVLEQGTVSSLRAG